MVPERWASPHPPGCASCQKRDGAWTFEEAFKKRLLENNYFPSGFGLARRVLVFHAVAYGPTRRSTSPFCFLHGEPSSRHCMKNSNLGAGTHRLTLSLGSPQGLILRVRAASPQFVFFLLSYWDFLSKSRIPFTGPSTFSALHPPINASSPGRSQEADGRLAACSPGSARLVNGEGAGIEYATWLYHVVAPVAPSGDSSDFGQGRGRGAESALRKRP